MKKFVFWGIGIFVVLFIIGVASGDDKKEPTKSFDQIIQEAKDNQSESKEQYVEASSDNVKEFQNVLELSGRVSKKTDVFEFSGGKQRISYKMEGGEHSAYYVKAVNIDTGKSEYIAEIFDPGVETSFSYLSKGKYYLDIDTVNDAIWSITIEEER